VGISSFVSLGDKDDVSGNDMLLWFESDAATNLAVLYLESFGNPRKFARTARQLGRTLPILAVNAGRSAKGKRLAAARASATVPRPLTRQALFEQAGVIATANFGELLDAAALLASQPVPAGSRVAVVSNTRGGGILAADACDDAGLQAARLAADTQRALRDVLPAGAAVAGPVDTGGAGRAQRLPAVPGARRRRPRSRRGAGADGHDRGQQPGPRGARCPAASADRRGGDGPG
jgi:acyl-CoA synthetase (NDP forming)